MNGLATAGVGRVSKMWGQFELGREILKGTDVTLQKFFTNFGFSIYMVFSIGDRANILVTSGDAVGVPEEFEDVKYVWVAPRGKFSKVPDFKVLLENYIFQSKKPKLNGIPQFAKVYRDKESLLKDYPVFANSFEDVAVKSEGLLDDLEGLKVIMIGTPPAGWSTARFAAELAHRGMEVHATFVKGISVAFFNENQVSHDKLVRVTKDGVRMIPYRTVMEALAGSR